MGKPAVQPIKPDEPEVPELEPAPPETEIEALKRQVAELSKLVPKPVAAAPAVKMRQRYSVRHADDAERLLNLGLLPDKEIERCCQIGLLRPSEDKLEALRARGLKVDPVKVDDPDADPDMEPAE